MGRTHKTADINAQMDEKARAEEGTRRLERRRLDSAQTRSEKEKAVGRAQAQQFRPHATLAADDKKEETVEEGAGTNEEVEGDAQQKISGSGRDAIMQSGEGERGIRI